ncbi:MAG: hypothetical protein F4121_02940 [Acidimicrobiia bacterium]|nr:hypothetical protein [Acidimicrobiia bacterium]MYC46607.1 hypothetical protein [Acidimicrobiia bacterium]MYI19061.1 hypothetical protein [Acidimicrobiia bacterium]
MAPTEAQRLELQQELIGVLKKGPAKTLMESLPPMEWRELATKTDLALLKDDLTALEERMDLRLEALRTELGAKIDTGLADVRGEMKSDLAKQTYIVLAGVAAALAAAMTPVYIALFTGLAG